MLPLILLVLVILLLLGGFGVPDARNVFWIIGAVLLVYLLVSLFR